MQLLVRAITLEAEDVLGFEVVHPQRTALPPFTAGSHVDVTVANGMCRQYSLCNDPRERHRYRIAVLRERGGRGGSKFMHEQVRVGDHLDVSSPRNNFALNETAGRSLLIAGGIGVTPLLSMAYRLRSLGASYEMHYCTRNVERTAFAAELSELSRGAITFHHDHGDPARGLDIGRLLREPEPRTHVYCCGPTAFMRAVQNASAHWPSDSIHFEYFAAPSQAGVSDADSGEFEVELASTGAVYAVPADQSILAVLRAAGVNVDSSCEAGVCGTCRTRYLRGNPDHRDFVLTDAERRDSIMPCVSRAQPGERLILDC
jgi:vanillate O-demethylase ferredoxin subunit